MDMEALGLDVYNLITSSGWEVYPYGRGTNPEDIPAAKLGAKAFDFKILGERGNYELIESQTSYSLLFTPEKYGLNAENSYFWNVLS